jgi:hypothetical protein
MANEEHLAILKNGASAWNEWRRQNPGVPDLTEADLRGAELMGANFRGANLSGADLSGANIEGADLRGADLYRADLSSANLRGVNLDNAHLRRAKLREAYLPEADLHGANLNDADLSEADLRAAKLRNADLWGANLSKANLSKADFSGARVVYGLFGDCDLRETKGLDLVKHAGPSSIGIDTIYKSEGKIPESFLRGCGVFENLIRYIPALVGSEEGIQFYSCFISYSSKDDEFALKLHGRMRDAHLRVWFALKDMPGGKMLHEEIEKAIRVYDKLLIVLSQASLKSKWVMTELRKARKDEVRTGKRKLFPIRLVGLKTLRGWECIDSDTGEDLAVEVRKYFIPDFSLWKDHDKFEASFSRLLEDLRADGPIVG